MKDGTHLYSSQLLWLIRGSSGPSPVPSTDHPSQGELWHAGAGVGVSLAWAGVGEAAGMTGPCPEGELREIERRSRNVAESEPGY